MPTENDVDDVPTFNYIHGRTTYDDKHERYVTDWLGLLKSPECMICWLIYTYTTKMRQTVDRLLWRAGKLSSVNDSMELLKKIDLIRTFKLDSEEEGNQKMDTKMKAITQDLEVLIKEMNAVDQMDDDLFIQFFEKEEAMQERLEALKDANKLTAEEYEEYSGRLVEAFGRLKGKLSFCNLG